jgi:1,2-dihydroxy-3-keto-5-methylthiopentene dioxygenase
MSQLSIYAIGQSQQPLQVFDNFEDIHASLADVGIAFEQWQPDVEVKPGDDPDKILNAFSGQIDQLKQLGGYQQADVISLNASHPDKAVLRQKFLSEHTHSADEVRFFVAGQGLFCLHLGDKIYQVLCQKNDLINVPANTKHWFDMGSEPDFVAIRLFINTDGWVANLTGDDIASQYPLLD